MADRLRANGIIATSSVTSAKADGYTLLLCTSGTALNQTLYKTPYDALTDLTPITNLITVPMLLVVNPSLPVKSVAEFLDYAKKNPNGMSYSSWGVGSSAHLAGEMLRLSVGVPMVHVPFKGSAGALSEVLAGRIPFAFTTIPLGLQHIKAGKLRLLGVTADAPVPQLPGVPLLKNSGLPELVVEGWNGLCAPGGLPNDVVQKLYKAVDATLKEPAVRERLTDEGYVIIGNRPSEFSRAFKAEVPKWAELVKKANIKVN